ncbi:uncharacterized protein EDB91DRAFT_1080641 [Suillus paluster]|uniref:uncharacterized protein n=1 Tax=Suillus paluster TaxID=48578 RepID=UPI001B86673B|nr:uncharacterized protein EDB91DRAFT_1080641 [Suillus paluster]KAG1744528.1 hypothetical protein EDB91DRAFT_1080641 [Suillus paluster]
MSSLFRQDTHPVYKQMQPSLHSLLLLLFSNALSTSGTSDVLSTTGTGAKTAFALLLITAAREAVGTAIHTYHANSSIEGSQKTAELTKTILEVALQHRLHLDVRTCSAMLKVFRVEPKLYCNASFFNGSFYLVPSPGQSDMGGALLSADGATVILANGRLSRTVVYLNSNLEATSEHDLPDKNTTQKRSIFTTPPI